MKIGQKVCCSRTGSNVCKVAKEIMPRADGLNLDFARRSFGHIFSHYEVDGFGRIVCFRIFLQTLVCLLSPKFLDILKCRFGKEGVLKSKRLRKQTWFKIQFYAGIHLTWIIVGLGFSVLDFLPVVLFRRFGLKSGHLKMQIPQGRSAQIKKLKKTNWL